MKIRTYLAVTAILGLCGTADAQTLDLSIGVRETGGSGPAFANGGIGGGIEWVNLDGQQLIADGTWQFFEWTPTTDTLTGFAGTTANGVLDTDWGVLEHIRLRNSSGVTAPITIWLDDFVNQTAAGPVSQGFEGYANGAEVMFQEPGYSGSTAGFILAGGTAGVTDSTARSGSNSYQVDLQFVDATASNWVRLTSFNATNLANPYIQLRDPTGGSTPTFGFWAMAVIPEPATAGILGIAGLGLLRRRR